MRFLRALLLCLRASSHAVLGARVGHFLGGAGAAVGSGLLRVLTRFRSSLLLRHSANQMPLSDALQPMLSARTSHSRQSSARTSHSRQSSAGVSHVPALTQVCQLSSSRSRHIPSQTHTSLPFESVIQQM